jgi:DNA-binding NtrC family response regulator
VINCAQIPEGLVESELFGHEKGAFTGAHAAQEGAFARADGGTLFLDELGDLGLGAQARILRVIETGEIVRVGGGRRQVSVRVIAATHRNLEQMIGRGEFREDLYFRLRVVEVSLPPLAARRDDILPLALHFVSRERRADGEAVEGISDAAARALVAWDWPGNVRELRNVIERAVVLDTDGTIDIDDLPQEIAGAPEAGAPARVHGGPDHEQPWLAARKAFEREYFARALERHGWRIRVAAESCGVTRRTLANKIREHGIERPGRRRGRGAP